MNHYEQSALLFYSEKNFLMSYNLFLEALKRDKENTMFWYGLGDSLCGYANQKGIQKLYPIGVSCVKKAHEIDTSNQYASGMLERMKSNPSIGKEFISNLEALSYDQAEKLKVDIPAEKLIKNYIQIKSVDNKIKVIMHLGETKNSRFIPLLEHCILNEENQTIRFAALKRISFFQDDMDLKPIFDFLIADGKVEENEPYFSLAAGRIKKDWAKSIYSKFEKKLDTKTEEINAQKLNALLKDEVIYMNLSMLLLGGTDELNLMIQNNQRKEIGDKISLYIKPNVIEDLRQKGIINSNGGITALGIALLTEYLKPAKITQSKEIQEPQKLESKRISSSKNKKSHNKNWWRFW